MKKTKFQRVLAFVLAFGFLFGGAVSTSAASTNDKDVLAEMREQLNAISYEEYLAKYSGTDDDGNPLYPRAEEDIVIDATNTDPEKGSYYLGFSNDTEGAESGAYVTNEAGASGLFTPSYGSVSWKVNIPATAKYSIVIEYWPDKAKETSIERILKINNEIPFAEARFLTLPKIYTTLSPEAHVTDPNGEVSLQVIYDEALAAGFTARIMNGEKDGTYVAVTSPLVWTQAMADFVTKYEVRFFTDDIDDNELRSDMLQTPEWRTYELRDADGFYAESFEFVFEEGWQTIALEAVNEAMTIKEIRLIRHEDMITYEEYKAQYGNAGSGSDTVLIQAEYLGATSSKNIYPLEDRSDAATMPSSTDRVLLNTVGGDKWQTAGQWVRYTFKVNSSGFYNIAARYRQNVLDGMYVCRRLAISGGDYTGGVPFKEASELRFNYDSAWQSTLFNNGSTDENGNLQYYEFYFEAGVEYTLEMEVTLGSMGDIVRRVSAALTSINQDYLDIMKLTGANPDEYRDYGFNRVMPDTMIDMINQSVVLYKIAAELEAVTGEKSSNVATLERVAWLLDRMGKNEDEVAKYLDQLKSYIGTLGTWVGDAKTQPLQLDYIVIQPLNTEAPEAEAGFFASLWHEIRSFIMSFFRNYNRMGATAESDEDDDEIVEVWLAYGRDQAQVIRNLINNDFTPDTGVNINLKLVAGGTLLPSVLAGMGPDVYIGIGQGDVINYAIRGALLPIEDMSDFDKIALGTYIDENGVEQDNSANRQFNDAAMLTLGIADHTGEFHYYGLPETQNFNMMFIRTDILTDLNIAPPETWDDVLAAVPVLQANNMQIGMHTDYKIFLYQMGGELFADEGMRINLDSNVGLEAFDTMCSYFTMYSFPYKYDFANRFRTGEMPIGFASYNGTYNHLTVFATEIKGLWEFRPMPGIKNYETGEINNVSVSSVSAICMMNGCSNEAGSWEFMKWHAGAECQIDYSNEMVAIIGPSAKHATANIQALDQMPWTNNEYTQIMAQFKNLASIPNYPGSYIIDRYTGFAFLAAYEDNADPITELKSYINIINKEITRKRQEFELETLEIGQTLTQKRIDELLAAYQADSEAASTALNDAAKNAHEQMTTGIEELNADLLRAAATLFASVDANAFEDTITALNRAATVIAANN